MRRKRLSALLCALVLLAALLPFSAGGEAAEASEASEASELKVDPCGLRGWNLEVGYQYVIMGYYPYTKKGEKAPVLWQVLGVENGKALLLTTYIIDAHQPIEVSDKKIADGKKYREISDYGETDLNVWLNEVMINDLLGDEPVLAAVTEEKYGRLYPLTDEELMTEEYGFTNQRFYEQRSRWAYATPYTLNKKQHPNYGSKVQKDGSNGTSSYWVAAVKKDDDGNPKSGHWLQICSGIGNKADPHGNNIGHLSYGYLNRTTVGLRLAVRLDTSKIQVISGNGSIWDPCRLAYVKDKSENPTAYVTPPVRPEPTPVPTTPAPVKGRPKLTTPGPDVTPVPVP